MKNYIVEVLQRPLGNVQMYTAALAKAFDISPDKAEHLVERLPGVVTRPIHVYLAREIAKRFQDAGLEATVRPSEQADVDLTDSLWSGTATGVFSGDFSVIEFNDLPLPLEDTGYDTMLGVDPEAFVLDELGLGDEPEPPPKTTPYDLSLTPAAQALLSDTGSYEVPQKPSLSAAPQRHGKIFGRLLSIAILPTLLAIIGALVVTWFVVRPALYDQLLDSARNPAIAAAASLSSQLDNESETEATERLLETILLARETFPRDSVSFIVATDVAGKPLAASFAGVSGLLSDNRELENAIRTQAVRSVTLAPDQPSGGGAQLRVASGESYEIVAQPIKAGEQTLGTVVVGVTDRAVTRQVNRILLTTLLFSLIPLALAIVFAATRARSFSRTILSLTRRADAISRGNLTDPVETSNSGDELEDLGQALERMRVSMQEAMDRLRRRRT